MRVSVFILYIVFLASCHTPPQPDNYALQNYQVQKMTLEQQEKQNPLTFLSSDGTYRQNIMGRFVLDGTIVNKATVATYKDVVLEVSFYSQTKTLLGTQQYTLYEYYPPGSSKTFQLKIDGEPGTKKIGWSIVQASNN